MVLAIGGVGSSYSSYGANSALSLNGLGRADFSNFNPIKNRKSPAQEIRGPVVKTRMVPEALQWLSKKIEKDFKVKIRNSDIGFSEEELKRVWHGLCSVVEKGLTSFDLKGVKEIVKNKSIQLNFETMPSSVFAKMHDHKVYGAYDKENGRIYIFELDNVEQLIPVLKHEVGHAVHSHNLSFPDFFNFTLNAGWDVAYHEQHYISGNDFYNVGMTKVVMSKEKALEEISHFDWDSIKDKKGKFNKYVLMPPVDKKDMYAYKNPYETFAVYYEKTR